MLKLLSDPTVYPIREVPLQRADGTLAVVGISDAGGFEDLTYPRPDGGSNVIYRSRRTALQLEVDALGYDAFRALEELVGNTPWNRTKTPVQVSAWFDRHTWLYAPLTGTLKALKRNVATSVLEKVDLTHTRASVLDIQDEAGNVKSLASGELGYVPSVIGPGAYTHFENHDQLLALPHATGGATLGWASGSATLSWDTTQRSPYRAAGGVLRAEIPASTAWDMVRTHDTGSADTNDHYLVSVELRGRGRCRVRAVFGLTGNSSSYVDLTDQWQTVYLDVPKTSAVTTIAIYIEGLTPVPYQSTVFVGRCGLYFETSGANPSVFRIPPLWQTSGARAVDAITTPFGGPGANGTLTMAGLLPPKRFSYASMYRWENAGTRTHLGMYWNSTNPAYFFFSFGGVTVSLFSQSVDYVEGAPFVLVGRHGSDGRPRLDLFTAGQHYSAVGTADMTANTVATTAQIAERCAIVAPQHLRYDGRVWSDIEVRSYGRLMESEALRPILLRTAGRRFLVTGVDLLPVRGRRQERSGTITLEQHDRDLDFAIGK